MNVSLLTEEEAARKLSISPRTLRKLRKEGKLHYIRIRSSIRYSPDDLDLYVESARSCTYISEMVRPTGGSTLQLTVADFEKARRKRLSAKPD
ncbi:MAG: DNA-binding protein [Sphingobium sp.]|nr:DNA-binding protein [Sphingobium sp.]